MGKFSVYLKIIFSFFVWSLLGLVLNKSSLSPFQNIFLISILPLVYIFAFPSLKKNLQKIKVSRDVVLFLLFSGFSGVIWLKSLTLLPIAQAVLLYSSVPLFVTILEAVILKEKIDTKHILIILLGLLGVIFILSGNLLQGESNFILGGLVVLFAAFLNSMQALFNKKISSHYSFTTIIFLIMFAQAAVSFPLTFISKWNLDAPSISYVIFLSIFSSLIAFYFYVDGFKKLKASSVVLAGYTEPFFAAVWGYFFLSQFLDINILVGGAVILLAGYLKVKSED